MSTIRTRFAPSPTGFMHVGGARTALFAWLIARQAGGQFILRIEDTDQARLVSQSVDHIIKTLSVLGIDYDEGPDKNGPYGPYTQSQRLDIYHSWAKKLIDQGRAYTDPYSKEEIDNFKLQAKKDKKLFLYRDIRLDKPIKWQIGLPLRFLSDPKQYTWQDAVMGELSAGSEAIDDFILIKSDGYPTYNFGHIIDDYLMRCTHVIRSQEFIASTPKFLNLYEALNIEKPILATLPPILNNDGKKKLSKRDGAKDILEYINQGYLPETIINFLASLGWNDGTVKEIFSIDELISSFSLKRVQKAGAIFDENRLKWMNGYYIRQLDQQTLYQKMLPFWPEEAKNYDEQYKQKILNILQDRLKFGQELKDLSIFFFEDQPINLDLINNNKLLSKLGSDQLVNLLQNSYNELSKTEFNVDQLVINLNQLLDQTNQKPSILFSLIRIAITQVQSSPGLADTMEILGQQKTLRRIQETISALENKL